MRFLSFTVVISVAWEGRGTIGLLQKLESERDKKLKAW